MAFERQPAEASAAAAGRTVVRGLLVRMAYGAIGFGAVMLIRPDFLGKNQHLLVSSIAAYLLVCLAGGIVDATGKTASDLRWLPRQGTARVLSGLAVVVALVVLWLGP